VCARSLFECTRAGYTTVLWSYDSGDSRSAEPHELLAQFAAAPPRSGDIVLLHEDQRHTLEALPELVRSLESSGYELCTVGELFAG
jgi:peptidoglycan/xylan/chitin deacetylase (PgdA/CDA1 family)